MRAETPRIPSLIDGGAVAPRCGGHDITLIDPAREQTMARIARLRDADASEKRAAGLGKGAV